MKSFTVVFRSIDRFSLENTAVISINDSENLCEPSPILAPLGEILCEPRRLWRHGSRAPDCACLISCLSLRRLERPYTMSQKSHYQNRRINDCMPVAFSFCVQGGPDSDTFKVW